MPWFQYVGARSILSFDDPFQLAFPSNQEVIAVQNGNGTLPRSIGAAQWNQQRVRPWSLAPGRRHTSSIQNRHQQQNHAQRWVDCVKQVVIHEYGTAGFRRMRNPFHPTLRDRRPPHLAQIRSEDSGMQRILSFHGRCHKVRCRARPCSDRVNTLSRHVSGDFGPSALIGIAGA